MDTDTVAAAKKVWKGGTLPLGRDPLSAVSTPVVSGTDASDRRTI